MMNAVTCPGCFAGLTIQSRRALSVALEKGATVSQLYSAGSHGAMTACPGCGAGLAVFPTGTDVPAPVKREPAKPCKLAGYPNNR